MPCSVTKKKKKIIYKKVLLSPVQCLSHISLAATRSSSVDHFSTLEVLALVGSLSLLSILIVSFFIYR